MSETANLKLPFIMPSQAQKHVTHNEGLTLLDAVLHLSFVDRTLTAPPGSPAAGSRYLVASPAEGAWTGKAGRVAAFQDGAWIFMEPRQGWLAWDNSYERLIVFDAGEWRSALEDELRNAALVGVNAEADVTNRLSVKSPASLFDGEDGSHRLKVNKATAADTSSILLQTGYSARAELGLMGDDLLRVKVSADGASWVEACTIRPDGRVLLPAALDLEEPDQAVARRHVREMLTADRTYYVRPDGSDANSGLADSASAAFATVGRAISVVYGGLDIGDHHVKIQLGDGTYAESISIAAPHVGSGTVSLMGNSAAPQNTVLAGAAGSRTIQLLNGAALTVGDFELRGDAAPATFVAKSACLTVASGMRFGAATTAQLYAQDNGVIDATGSSYAVVGSCSRHLLAVTGSVVNALNCTVALSGTPAFSTAYAQANRVSIINVNGSTFSGSATGKRYDVTTNGVVFTNGGGANFLPGNTAGTSATGGQYA